MPGWEWWQPRLGALRGCAQTLEPPEACGHLLSIWAQVPAPLITRSNVGSCPPHHPSCEEKQAELVSCKPSYISLSSSRWFFRGIRGTSRTRTGVLYSCCDFPEPCSVCCVLLLMVLPLLSPFLLLERWDHVTTTTRRPGATRAPAKPAGNTAVQRRALRKTPWSSLGPCPNELPVI